MVFQGADSWLGRSPRSRGPVLFWRWSKVSLWWPMLCSFGCRSVFWFNQALHTWFCPSVLYFSWHRYEHQKFWPQLRESDFDSVGKEKGAGFNINVPWNQVSQHRNTSHLKLLLVQSMRRSSFCRCILLYLRLYDIILKDNASSPYEICVL